MSLSPTHDDILDDDSLAPLKRNHACLQCKKRKVKCDGSKPACAPCMRSHAHALRTAQRNKTSPPALVCTWADSDSPEPEEPRRDVPPQHTSRPPMSSGEAKKNSAEMRKSGEAKKNKGSVVGGKSFEREKDRRRDEEKETLLVRIAELEARLAGLSPSENPSEMHPQRQASSSNSLHTSPEQIPIEINSTYMPSGSGSGSSGFQQAWVPDANPGPKAQNELGATPDVMDFSNLFMIPAKWPRNLPSPFLLEHLVEVFFTYAPQMPRMIHRPSFMTRLRLPPTHTDFPHPALLHAICACASTFTAWVNTLPPEALEEAIERHKEMYGSLEGIEDFGLAQAEAAQRAISVSTQSCLVQSGNVMVEICQANIMLADIYFTKGMPMQGWIVAGIPPRMLKALEIMNKNNYPRYKEPLMGEPADSVEREQRLATVWMAFITDAGFTLNSYWNGSMDLEEVLCPLPISYTDFKGRESYSPPNSQTAHTPDMLAHHPVADSFVLVVKASTLVSRVAKWLRKWKQRDIMPGDEMSGVRLPTFTALVNDIYVFQASIPSAMKNIFRILDASSTSAFDANVLLIHILPSVALCALHEPFADWEGPSNLAIEQLQRNYEAVAGILHLIPSNLDVTLVMTPIMSFCLYTVGRIVANFVHRNSELQQYAIAVRQRADMQNIQNILNRYGQKHALGQWMSSFLDGYLARLQRGEKIPSNECIRDKPLERQKVRTEASPIGPTSSDEADATAAAATAYFTAPSHTARMGPTAQKHHNAATGVPSQYGRFSNSSNSSATSGFTPPSMNTVTPPGGANLRLDQLSKTTPDMLDFTAHLDYGETMAQGAFYQLPGMDTQGMSQVGMDMGTYDSGQKYGQTRIVQGSSDKTLEEIFMEQAQAGFAEDASRIIWGGV